MRLPPASRRRTLRKRSLHPTSAVLIEPQSRNTGFWPGQESEGRKCRPRIAIDVLAIELYQHDIGVQLGAVHHLGLKKIVAAVRHPHPVLSLIHISEPTR